MKPTTTALQKICSLKEEWLHIFYTEDMLEYILISNIGKQLVKYVKEDEKLDLVSKVFYTIEDLLTEKDVTVASLIGAGMFETMQTYAYQHLNPPDTLSSYMEERTLKLWEDIIESWTAEGIRTIEDWQRIMFNGLFEQIIIELENTKERFELSKELVEKKLNYPPMMATRHIGTTLNINIAEYMGFATPHAVITVLRPSSNKEIIVGEKTDLHSNKRYTITNNDRIDILDMSMIENILIEKRLEAFNVL